MILFYRSMQIAAGFLVASQASIWLLTVGPVLATDSVPEQPEVPQFSVVELPPTAGSDQAQVAIRWSGALPVRLQIGRDADAGSFVPLAPPIILDQSMSLLPHPAPDADAKSRWRILDFQGETLAQTLAGSPEFGWQPGYSGPGMDGAVSAATIYNGELVVGGTFRTAGDLVVNNIARWDGSQWVSLEGALGVQGVDIRVSALAVYNGELIVGGWLISAGGISVRNIARWNGSRWASLDGPAGTGVNGQVYALTVYNDELIAGGEFTTAAGVTVNRIARWNGSEWAGLDGPEGTGVTGNSSVVSALTVYSNELIVGGWFFRAGEVLVNSVARWDGTRWAGLDGPEATGVGGRVRALTVYNGELIVGGAFGSAGGLTIARIARWDGIQWRSLDNPTGWGSPSFPFNVNALTVYGGELIAGGASVSDGQMPVIHIGRWDGNQWANIAGPLGTGVNAPVREVLTEFEGELIVGGIFTKAGGVAVNRIGRWNGSEWAAFGSVSGFGMDGWVWSLTVYNGELIAGGEFVTAGGVTVNRIARWDGSRWASLDGPSGTGVSSSDSYWPISVYALTVYDGELIAGGYFTEAGGVASSRIARWNGSRWASLEGPTSGGISAQFWTEVRALTVYDGELIAGGTFSTAGGVTVNNIARWNGNEWAALSGPSAPGMNNAVEALSLYNGELIAGGPFTTAGGETVNYIARWNGSQWNSLAGPEGTGMGGATSMSVYALSNFNGELIAGGYFPTAGGVPVNNIARWNGSEWAALTGPAGTGMTYDVRAMTVYNDELIAGGGFLTAGGVTAHYIAQWNGSDWQSLDGSPGPGMTGGWVHALNVYDEDLFAGGGFVIAGDMLSWRIGQYIQPFAIGGSVTGLMGTGLLLQNSGGDDLLIEADGPFVFPTPVGHGRSYAVTVLNEPSDPTQICTVVNGFGNVDGADVDDIEVTCIPVIFRDRFEIAL